VKSGWTTSSLGDVCLIVGGGTPPKEKAKYYSGKIPWATVRDMHSEVINDTEFRITEDAVRGCATKIIPSGNVVIATRVGLGKICMLGQDTAINQDLRGIIPKDPHVLSVRFVYWWLRSVARLLVAEGTGATVQGIKLPFVKSLQIRYPNRPEQLRLVRILDESSSGISTAQANSETNLQNSRALFESCLSSAFTTRGKGWERASLATLLERGWIEGHLDGNHGNDYPRKSEFLSKGVPYVSARCLADDQVDLTRAKYLSPDRAALLRKGIAKNDDVLFAHNATVGPVAVLQTSEEKVILGTSVTYYRCNRARILPQYLAHYMRSHEFKTQYLQVMGQSTRNQVPITKQREFIHVVPPLPEQQRLVSQLDALREQTRRLAAIYRQKGNALSELRESLLGHAFRGRA